MRLMLERQVYSRFCSLRHLSHARRLGLRLRLHAGPDYAATCDVAWRRYCDGIKCAPCGPHLTHPPCSRPDIRLAAAVAGNAGGLLPHLFQPSPVRAGYVCCCSCRRPSRDSRTCCFVRRPCMWESGSSSRQSSRRAAEPLPSSRRYCSRDGPFWQNRRAARGVHAPGRHALVDCPPTHARGIRLQVAGMPPCAMAARWRMHRQTWQCAP